MSPSKRLTPVKAIRQWCVRECNNGVPSGVRECTYVDCPLYEYRMGKNPYCASKGKRREAELPTT